MSTAQDHKRIAAELTDVFGPGAGSSGYNFNSGGATFSSIGASGPSGRGGTPGDVGKTILGLGNVGMSIVSGKGLSKANAGLVDAMNNPTIEGLTSAIEKGKEAQSTFGVARTVADVDKYSRMATGAGDLLTTGDAGTLGSNVVDVASASTGGIAPVLGLVEDILPGPNPIAKTTDFLTGAIDKFPGAGKANEVLDSFGNFVQGIPGAAKTGELLTAFGNVPGDILGYIPKGIIDSFKNKDKNEAAARDAALTQLFTQEDAEGKSLLKAPSGSALDETPTHVAFPGGSYNFPYQGAGGNELTLADLYEEFLASDSGQTLAGQNLQTLIDVEEKSPTSPTPPLYGPPAPPVIKDEDYPLPDLSNSPRLSSPASTAGLPLIERLEVARAGLDQYPPLPTQTQRHDPSLPNYKEMPPLNYYTFPQFPPEPLQFKAPAAPEAEYQAPKAPTPAEVAPRSRSDGSFSLDGGLTWTKGENPLKRVRPEELATPRIMTPRRIRPQKRYRGIEVLEETAPSKMSRHEQDLANYEMLVKAKQEADRKRPGMGWGRISFNSSRNNVGLESTPKHNLRELTTGRNASSY
tara:strand:+ start:1595 stop:3328 length:1734 start_codon:yes stop_codon:yes gene_type:complete